MAPEELAYMLGGARVAFLCGPPGAGKDTLARLIQTRLGADLVMITKMAAVLDDMTRPLFPSDLAFRLYRETLKEVPCQFLGGVSIRKWYQDLSETFLKPRLGADGFGRACVQRVHTWLQNGGLVVVSDSGFLEEAVPLINAVGPAACVQIRIHREGCTFAGDTRNWWAHPGVRVMNLRNGGDGDQSWSLLSSTSGAKAAA